MKTTEWFSAEVKPVKVGVYEAHNVWGDGRIWARGYAHWDGKAWGNVRRTADDAAEFRKRYGANDYGHQRKVWRGLTEPAA
jgi:hypothetical protein